MGTATDRHVLVAALALSLALSATDSPAQSGSTVAFDNQSGEPALVKLVGPTARDIDVPAGIRRAVAAAPGRYCIKIRYGVAGKYRYACGREFEVVETTARRPPVAITLHKAIADKHGTRAISEEEFGRRGDSPPASARLESKPKHDDLEAPAFWATAQNEYVATMVTLSRGSYGYIAVPLVAYNNRQFQGKEVKSANAIEVGGRKWPADTVVYRIGKRWDVEVAKPDPTVGKTDKKPRKYQFVVETVTELGAALGYRVGDALAPPEWGSWPK